MEGKQVEQWLTEDKNVQGLYTRLLTIRQGIHNLPMPPQTYTEEKAFNLFSHFQHVRLIIFGKIIAVPVCRMTAMAWFVERENPVKHLAKQKYLEQPQKGKIPVLSYSLKVAVNDPIFCIPKTIRRSDLGLQEAQHIS